MKSIIASLLLVISLQVKADPSFTNITETDMENISKEMSANFTHSALMGASKMGTIFGFQVGLMVAQTGTPEINTIMKRSGGELSNLYNAGLMGALGIPFGISFEATMIPKVTASGASLSANSLAVKWNINEVIPVLPVNLALRGIYSDAKFEFSQTIAATPMEVSNKTKVTGIQLLFSPMFPVIEPYVGIGLLNGTDDLSVTGTPLSIFSPTYTTAQSASKSVSGTQLLAGVEANLLIMKLGAEYSQAFGTSRVGVKLAFGF